MRQGLRQVANCLREGSQFRCDCNGYTEQLAGHDIDLHAEDLRELLPNASHMHQRISFVWQQIDQHIDV